MTIVVKPKYFESTGPNSSPALPQPFVWAGAGDLQAGDPDGETSTEQSTEHSTELHVPEELEALAGETMTVLSGTLKSNRKLQKSIFKLS